MKGFVQDIEGLAVKNSEFRRVLYTAKHCQLVVMALKPKEEIGAEVHKLDQFFRVEEGTGEAVLDGVRTVIRAGFAVVVPAGAKHNIINTGSVPLKLYTLYAPPIIGTASSTIPARTLRPTTNTSTVKRRNRDRECRLIYVNDECWRRCKFLPFSRYWRKKSWIRIGSPDRRSKSKAKSNRWSARRLVTPSWSQRAKPTR